MGQMELSVFDRTHLLIIEKPNNMPRNAFPGHFGTSWVLIRPLPIMKNVQ